MVGSLLIFSIYSCSEHTKKAVARHPALSSQPPIPTTLSDQKSKLLKEMPSIGEREDRGVVPVQPEQAGGRDIPIGMLQKVFVGEGAFHSHRHLDTRAVRPVASWKIKLIMMIWFPQPEKYLVVSRIGEIVIAIW